MNTDFQNAFEVSKMLHVSNDESAKIKELLDAGKFVVYETGIIYCRYTDATLSSEQRIVKTFDDFETANSFWLANLDQYEYLNIQCPDWYMEEQKSLNDDFDVDNDIPF